MQDEIYPLCIAQAVPRGAGIRFLHPKEQYDIDGHAELIWNILEHCSGYEPLSIIVKKTAKALPTTSPSTVEAVLQDLLALGVLVDSREAYRHFHTLSSNPMYYVRDMSSKDVEIYTTSERYPVKTGVSSSVTQQPSLLAGLLGQRYSCRGFSDESLTLDQLGHILVSGYSLPKHSTPSGGGLYPLKIFMIVTRDQADFRAGYYEFDPESHQLSQYCTALDIDQLQFAFDHETLLYNAPVIIVIAADLDRQSRKYSNRGYRYTLIEVGHAAQNMHLAAMETGIETLEYGGFGDELVANELGLDYPRITPVVTLALGTASSDEPYDASRLLDKLSEEFVGPKKPVRYVEITHGTRPERGESFYRAGALHAASPNEDARSTLPHRFTTGTGVSSALAQVKAIAEAYERYATGLAHVDLTAKVADISGEWFDPRRAFPFSSQQYLDLPLLQPFDPDQDWQWVQGINRRNGEPVWVPVDLVFFPLTSELFNRKLCLYATSSGVAAYTSEPEAFIRGLLELIERDCIMRNWFARKPAKQVPTSILPLHIQRRIAYWESRGRSVYVLDLSNYGAVTANVILLSNTEFPCFTHGAATSIHSFEEALVKAFHEAETMFHLQESKGKSRRSISPMEVMNPMDHANFYSIPDYLDNLEWMWQGEQSTTVPEPTTTMENLVERFDPVTVTLSPSDASLQVVRVLSTELIPISFGLRTECYLHHSFDQGNLDPMSLALPHYFA